MKSTTYDIGGGGGGGFGTFEFESGCSVLVCEICINTKGISKVLVKRRI